jgi:hypothetical protein
MPPGNNAQKNAPWKGRERVYKYPYSASPRDFFPFPRGLCALCVRLFLSDLWLRPVAMRLSGSTRDYFRYHLPNTTLGAGLCGISDKL